MLLALRREGFECWAALMEHFPGHFPDIQTLAFGQSYTERKGPL
jgi:hypothetical protein